MEVKCIKVGNPTRHKENDKYEAVGEDHIPGFDEIWGSTHQGRCLGVICEGGDGDWFHGLINVAAQLSIHVSWQNKEIEGVDIDPFQRKLLKIL